MAPLRGWANEARDRSLMFHPGDACQTRNHILPLSSYAFWRKSVCRLSSLARLLRGLFS